MEISAPGRYLTVPVRDALFDGFDRRQGLIYTLDFLAVRHLLVHEPTGVRNPVHRHFAIRSQHFLDGVQIHHDADATSTENIQISFKNLKKKMYKARKKDNFVGPRVLRYFTNVIDQKCIFFYF